MTDQRVTRLAPSPTGALHLGNARTFLINWLAARKLGWRVVLRIEDLDGPRVKKHAIDWTIEDLQWLAIDWDIESPLQSQRCDAYQHQLDILRDKSMAYRCTCSRRDIERAASAPHADERFVLYPGTCRTRQHEISDSEKFCWRVITDNAVISFDDAFAGPQRFDISEIGGDFVIFKADKSASYQLAVVTDDIASGVTDIVRGDDLLDSAARQLHLMKLLGVEKMPRYWHLPLVLGEDGRRLAKRHGDTRLRYYREEKAATPERMLGLLGYWCGLIDTLREAEMDELLSNFDFSRLPRETITFTADEDKFLCGEEP